jgi:hypothetical protein
MAMTIIDALGDAVPRARHRDDQRAAPAREYFFIPSLSALRWIGNLAETHSIEQKER